ncbi:MAG: putative Ig domain-containing protein, partial [Deltaproteobacteria bacterium]|nr:putative Ig domain-containing protein [Deltaproteobacteria bacterium]
VTALATDGDSGATISYSLTDNAGGRFAINAATGVITVTDGTLLDYEAATSHTVTVLATSSDGSTNSGNFTISILDRTPPSAPVITTITDNVTPVEGTVANGGHTNDTTPTLIGTAEANSTVGIYDNGTLVTTVVADGNGSWSYTPGALADGTTHGYTVTATDAAGNVSRESAAYAVTIDTTPPAAPTVLPVATLSTAPVIGGSWDAGPGNVLDVTINGVTYRPGDGNLTVSGNSWTLTIPAANALTAGVTYDVTARVTDRAGNSASDTGSGELIVISPPPPPAVTVVPATSTSDSTPVVVPPAVTSTATQQAPPAETASPDSLVAMLATQSQPASGVVSVAAVPEAGTQAGLMAVLSPNRQDVSAGEEATFQLPAGTFRQSDPAATTRMEASQADGTPLPAWIRFDASSGTFSGVAPAGMPQTLDVRVVARDDHGNTAAVRFEISVNENASRAGINAVTPTPVAPSVPAAASITPITPSAQTGPSAAPSADAAPSRDGQQPASPGDVPATSRQSSTPSSNVAVAVPVLQPAAAASYLVTRGGEEHSGASLYVRLDPPAQEATVNRLSTFQLPQGIFVTTNPDVQVTLKASQNDGSPLPSWINFNPNTGTFTGTPPVGTAEVMEVKLTARDSNGNETSAVFRLRINQQDDKGASLAPSDRQIIEASAALAAQADDGDAERVSPADPRHAPQRAIAGRPSLADQFARHGHRGMELERQQMVRTLQRGFVARQAVRS